MQIHARKICSAVAAFNYGIRHASGAFISWLSCDDLYESTEIETQVAYLKEKHMKIPRVKLAMMKGKSKLRRLAKTIYHKIR